MLKKIIKRVNISLAIVCVTWITLHQILTVVEENRYPPLGDLVEVKGKQMHIYQKGKGKQTIVLLAGLGTPAPVVDFSPLMNELSHTYKVVVVEPFGYGWSDFTEGERSVENIIGEVRSALKKADIQGPYILMPHSVSGIYAMYYANHYPDEVEAIVGIDPTFPKMLRYFGEAAPTMPIIFRFAAPTGVARLVVELDDESYLPITQPGTYSSKELKMIKVKTSIKGYNKNIIMEMNEIERNINKTESLNIPNKVPVLIFAKNFQKEKNGKSIQSFYEQEIANQHHHKVVMLNGHHYLHWTHSHEIVDELNLFLKQTN
ncbi:MULTISPECIES: alpha/beta hydrolase [Bacillaceae]|uniref:alpha/beta fold hydrolase n=1 Tax=Bacillaceae TaxID=186817 RepID=UPI00211B2BE4|nr:alpha/beta hydrolase [Bacillus sp. CBEL-1]